MRFQGPRDDPAGALMRMDWRVRLGSLTRVVLGRGSGILGVASMTRKRIVLVVVVGGYRIAQVRGSP